MTVWVFIQAVEFKLTCDRRRAAVANQWRLAPLLRRLPGIGVIKLTNLVQID